MASILPYATLLTVIVGVVFGSLQVRHGRRLRSLSAAIELVHTIRTPDFTSSIPLVLELPEQADPQEVSERPELVAAIYVVSHAFESLGVLVYYRLLPLPFVDHLLGGYVRASWARLKPYVEDRRRTLGPMFSEWFEWLADRMQEHPVPGKDSGAAVAYQRWRGPSPTLRRLRWT